MLVVEDLRVVYGRSIAALHGVSLTVPAQSIVALLGPNGVGKSTTLKAISGVLRGEHGEITQGSIRFGAHDLRRMAPGAIVEQGVVQVPEGRRLFGDLTVEENLLVGGCRRPQRELRPGLDRVYEWFPRLVMKRRTAAGYLSGGEQQMVAIGRALMARPQLLLLDEPSLGLAPKIVTQIFESLHRLRAAEGIAMLLVEQNANIALSIADHGHVIEGGRVVLSGSAAELRGNDIIRQAYLGISASGGRARFRRADRAAA